MTTAQVQVARTSSFISVALLLILIGCAQPSSTYQIEGAAGQFCVPRAVDATPARADVAEIIAGGFTLNGCWNSKNGNCVGPPPVISLFVSDKPSFVGRRYEDFPSDAHIRIVAQRKRNAALGLQGHLIAITDTSDEHKFYIWHVENEHLDKMSFDDELKATCVQKSSDSGYFCDRSVVGKDYVVGYSFYSNDIPTAFEEIDRILLRRVEEMRCYKSGVWNGVN